MSNYSDDTAEGKMNRLLGCSIFGVALGFLTLIVVAILFL